MREPLFGWTITAHSSGATLTFDSSTREFPRNPHIVGRIEGRTIRRQRARMRAQPRVEVHVRPLQHPVARRLEQLVRPCLVLRLAQEEGETQIALREALTRPA